MPYFVLEVDPIYVGDTAAIESFLKSAGASSAISIRTASVGGATHVVVELPADASIGFGVIAGPTDRAGAIAAVSAW